MSRVVVIGTGMRAAEWATRLAAAAHDVSVDNHATLELAHALWPAADRLGLFPGASVERITTHTTPPTSADMVQVVGGTHSVSAPLVAHEHTAVAASPVHLLPLVEVSGPNAAELAAFYRSCGMDARTEPVTDIERRQMTNLLIDLTDGDPDTLIAVMRSLRPSGRGAGAAMAHHEATRFAAGAIAPWQPGDIPSAPLALYRTPVEPDWVDYNGHMTEAAYLTAAGWASDALFRYIGDDEAYRAAGNSFYTVETHIVYVREVAVHEPIEFTTQVLGVDNKRVHLVHTMLHGVDGGLLCTAEQMLVHVDMNAGRSAAILPSVKAALDAIAASHASLPIPQQVGSVMQLPPPRTSSTH